MDAAGIIKRIDELIALSPSSKAEKCSEMAHGGVSIVALVYGPTSTQLKTFEAMIESTRRKMDGEIKERYNAEIGLVIAGALNNVKREINDGLIGSLTQQVTGDVLTDFILLARTTLNQNGDDAKNVAAVLAAAAFEDTIRRMGANLAGISDQRDLADVLIALKEKGVMQSPQIGIAQSYLSFRNHALHANWDKVQRESVHSVLGFVEQLLLKHFD